MNFESKKYLSLGLVRIFTLGIKSVILVFFVVSLSAQQEQSSDSVRLNMINAAKEIMKASGNCALITLDGDGRPRVRAMDPFPPTDQMEVWFGSNPHSRKIAQIKNDPRVSMYYMDRDSSGYVMIHGHAKIIDDIESKEIHWKEKWEDFYPDYPNDYILIKVVPEWLELISTRLGILGDPKTWEPPVIKFK